MNKVYPQPSGYGSIYFPSKQGEMKHLKALKVSILTSEAASGTRSRISRNLQATRYRDAISLIESQFPKSPGSGLASLQFHRATHVGPGKQKPKGAGSWRGAVTGRLTNLKQTVQLLHYRVLVGHLLEKVCVQLALCVDNEGDTDPFGRSKKGRGSRPGYPWVRRGFARA